MARTADRAVPAVAPATGHESARPRQLGTEQRGGRREKRRERGGGTATSSGGRHGPKMAHAQEQARVRTSAAQQL